jgi:hypothetical protein
VLLGESGYWENATNGHAFEQRFQNYWAVFHGSIGANYAANWIDHKPYLDGPGAEDMRHLADLIRSKPIKKRIPDQGMIPGGSSDSIETDQEAHSRPGHDTGRIQGQ